MNAPAVNSRLPAVLYQPDGTRRVDYRAVVALAWPLFVQFGVQAFLNVIDTWFVGRLGAGAVAGMNAVNFSSFTLLLLFGGSGIAVQTIVAQRYGEGRKARAASAVLAIASTEAKNNALLSAAAEIRLRKSGILAATVMGLTGEVHRSDFASVLAGRDPHGGERLISAQGSAGRRAALGAGVHTKLSASGVRLYGVADAAASSDARQARPARSGRCAVPGDRSPSPPRWRGPGRGPRTPWRRHRRRLERRPGAGHRG